MRTTSDYNIADEISSSLQTLTSSLQKSIISIIEKEKYIKYDVIVRDFNTDGDNFFGKIYEIDIIGATAEHTKETNILVKQRVDIKKIELVSILDLYTKEEFIYNDLSKVYTSLQVQANVPQEERYRIPKAYDETDNTAIILENLSKTGFKAYKKTEPVSIKYVELAIQQMAKFHALSFVVEYKMPEYHNSKIKVLKDPWCLSEDWEGLMRNVCRHVANLYDNDIKQRIENFVPILLDKFPKYCKDQSTVRCTLTHGDFKQNNLLVRSRDNEPEEIIPIDFQLMNYGCPIKDLLFFIFVSTDRECRKVHLNKLKELYFETLARFLKYFDMDVETVYPREEFETVFSQWLDYGLMIMLLASVFIFASETGIDFENQTLTEIPFCPNKMYDYIFRELVDDFIELGCL